MADERGSFSGKLGFVLSAAGAAVGLGCLWRFPNLVAQYGGGAFIITYIVLLATLGVTLFVVEVALGRKAQTGVLGAFAKLNPKFKLLGYLCLLVCLLIQPYYSVLCGHILKYGVMFATGQGSVLATPGFYAEYSAEIVDPIIYIVIFTILTGAVVFFGVRKGIERLCKILLPLEAILLAALAVYCMTIPGALDGLAYYLYPDFSKFSGELVLVAMGQVFYSLSIGFGVLITFGSYLGKRVNLVNSAWVTGFFTLLLAFIAGSLIIPATFMYTHGNPGIIGSSSIFESLPMIFETLPLGMVIGAAFFILLAFAALTANISTLEVMVTSIKDRFGISRGVSVVIMTLYTLALAIPISLGYGVLDWISINGMNLLDFADYLSGTVLLPIAALLICILVGYFIEPRVIFDELKMFSRFKYERLLIVMIKYVCPICIFIIFIYGLIGSFL